MCDAIADFWALEGCLTVRVGDTQGIHPLFVWQCLGDFDFHAILQREKRRLGELKTERIAMFIEGDEERAALVNALRFTADSVEALLSNQVRGGVGNQSKRGVAPTRKNNDR